MLELKAGWTSSFKLGKEFRQVLYFVEKAHVGRGDLLSHARVGVSRLRSALHVDQRRRCACRGELPEDVPTPVAEVEDLPESVTEMVWSAERKVEDDPEAALTIIQKGFAAAAE